MKTKTRATPLARIFRKPARKTTTHTLQPAIDDTRDRRLGARSEFLAGRHELQRNNLAGALIAFGHACEWDPTAPEFRAWFHWVTYRIQPERVDEIVSKLKALGRMCTRDEVAPVILILARVAKAEGDLEGARRLFLTLQELDPSNMEAKREERLYWMRLREEASDSWLQRLFTE